MAQIIVAGNPVNEFEKTVARTLGHLGEDCLLLTNVVLPGFYHKHSNIEIDLILLTRQAVYAIETKYWQGEVKGHINQKHWLVFREGNPPHQIENPLQRSEMKAKTLNTILSRWNSGLMGKLVTKAMVVLPPYTPMDIDNPTDIEVIPLERLLSQLEADRQRLPEEATDKQLQEMAQHLVGSSLPTEETLPFENYRISAILKASDRSVSYRAVNTFTERDVFIKKYIVDVNLPPDKQALWRNRAIREAKATSKVQHANIVTVHDVLEDQGNIYVICEWVDGWCLADRVDDLPWFEAVVYLAQACDGIDRAHAAKTPVVHRNINPSCILVADGVVKLTNFAFARIEGDPSIVFTELVGGRDMAYAAPELFSDGQADPRTDVYGLGATLYHLVTKTKPQSFMSRSSNPPAHDVRSDVPKALSEAIAKAMQPLPTNRFESASDFARALRSM
ncbi:MAG: serine/threonine protein kinase [Cyanobacteria bacterium REEB65]|nr:serine/threonine protein kinase [Cyanobacteria bacterium REEB65]